MLKYFNVNDACAYFARYSYVLICIYNNSFLSVVVKSRAKYGAGEVVY